MLYFPQAVSSIQILQMCGSAASMLKALSGDIMTSITTWWDDTIPVEVRGDMHSCNSSFPTQSPDCGLPPQLRRPTAPLRRM